MQGSNKTLLTDLNEYITCKICSGYFIDATTIIECLHTFCRSCVVKYLENNKYCPVCDVQVHKTKPLLNIRPDKTIQDIVFKLVPRLYHDEIKRRKEFYDNHLEAKPSVLEQCTEAAYQHILMPDETISLTLSYHGSDNKPRYLRCPVAVSIGHLKKLIRAKYDLTESHRVDILYNQDCLSSSLTLMDVAYIYFWKKKEPIGLTYRIYECVQQLNLKSTVPSGPAVSVSEENSNNNNWKEVQLRISENGEMSITGIQESNIDPALLEVVNSDLKYNNEVAVVDTKLVNGSQNEIVENCPSKSQPPEPPLSTAVSTTEISLVCTPQEEIKLNLTSPSIVSINTSSTVVSESQSIDLPMQIPMSNCASLSSATTTTVFSTINNSKCSTKSDDTYMKSVSSNAGDFITTIINNEKENSNHSSSPILNNSAEKSIKRKTGLSELEPPIKQSKMTIFNNSISLLNLSNNHPLKKHSKMNRNGENAKETAGKLMIMENEPISSPVKVMKSVVTSANVQSNTTVSNFNPQSMTTESSCSKINLVNKSETSAQASRPNTPISKFTKQSSIKIPTTAYTGIKAPCYIPKTTYNPTISLPKLSTSISSTNFATESITSFSKSSSINSIVIPNTESKTSANISHQQQNSKIGIKSKPSTPIGYKTLRDPPKSWNSQISKANFNKPPLDQRNSDLKNVKPKFFKMRNNMPRYLGNPASGVKPMYQVQTSPDKEKSSQEITNKMEKSEIKKHSIVKIDPKTLKPISEKAPETTSLSNHNSHSIITTQDFINASLNNSMVQQAVQNDLKINTSSVSIFNPLKLQSSPKSERKSPKSPHSPKTKSNICSGKRDKVNLTFTPPNPFVPRLASPLDPGQFLYPPPYDPRVMAAYTSLWYGQRLSQAGFPGATGFPGTTPTSLNLDLNQQQRKKFEMIAAVAAAQHTTQLSPTSSGISTICGQQNTLSMSSKPSSHSKRLSKEKYEKSLENTVEKLTQSRNKEVSNKSTSNSISILADNKENGEIDNRLEAKECKNVENKPEILSHNEPVAVSNKNSTTKDSESKLNLTEKQKQASSNYPESLLKLDTTKETCSQANHVKSTPEESHTSKESDKLKDVGLENITAADNNNETVKNNAVTRPLNGNEGKCENLSNSVKAVNNSDSRNSEVIVKGVE